MLGIIDKHIGKIIDPSIEEERVIIQELSNPRNENKRMIYVGMLKNILELLNVRNKGYSIVFMNQLMTDLQRSEHSQILPITKSENLLLTNLVNDIGYRYNSEESLQKIVQCQSYIRSFLYHKRYLTYKKFSQKTFQQINSSFLNIYEKQKLYCENIKILLYYLDEMKAQQKFDVFDEYPCKEYYSTLNEILKVEMNFKSDLDDIYGTFPNVSGVGEVVEKYCENIYETYKNIELQGSFIMKLNSYEKTNKELKEFYETLSKGQTYPFRYLLQSFPRISHFKEFSNFVLTMKEESEKLNDYKNETQQLNASVLKLNELYSKLKSFDNNHDEKIENLEIKTKLPELSTLLIKIKKEFTKTPSVVEVFLKLGKTIENIETKKFLNETKVIVEIVPNIEQFPPNLKTNTQSLSFNATKEHSDVKKGSTLRPKIVKRTNRQKEEIKLKATGELKQEIEILKNNDLESMRFEATLFVMNDVIFIAKMDKNEKFHIVSEVSLIDKGFSVSNCDKNTFFVFSHLFDTQLKFVFSNDDGAKHLFSLLREVCNVHSSPKLFGNSLEDILEKEGNTTGVPNSIKCVGDYLMNPEHLTVEGIFRKNGNANKILKLSHFLDQMPDHFDNFAEFDIHDITSVFKKFFMELKFPVFSDEVVDLLIKVPKNENEKSEIKRIMKEKMKPQYFNLCHYLMNVVKKTVENEAKTRMNANAMSVCIGPALIRSTNEIVIKPKTRNSNTEETVERVNRCNAILAQIIDDVEYFF